MKKIKKQEEQEEYTKGDHQLMQLGMQSIKLIKARKKKVIKCYNVTQVITKLWRNDKEYTCSGRNGSTGYHASEEWMQLPWRSPATCDDIKQCPRIKT